MAREGTISDRLDGWNAVVTGGSYGLGPRIGRALAEAGANVALAARSVGPLEERSAELRALGVEAVGIPIDLTERGAVDRLVGRVERELGPVDLLVNNAGLNSAGRLVARGPEEIDRVIDLNLRVPIQLTRRVLPGMLERGRGHLVQMSSLAGKMGASFASLYSASKYGLVGFTHALQGELDGTGVHASVVCPGFVSGEGMWARTELRTHPLFGLSEPERVVRAVMKAIRRKKVEVLVNPLPVRYSVAAWALAPGFAYRMFRLAGVISFLRRFGLHAEREGTERGGGAP